MKLFVDLYWGVRFWCEDAPGSAVGGWTDLLQHHPEELDGLPPGVRQLISHLAKREGMA